MEINIAHLYPELLNLYGDKGNIASLIYRLNKRGIECRYTKCDDCGNFNPEQFDIVLLGGGGDSEVFKVLEMLRPGAAELKAYIENGGVMLALCQGFELLGNYIEKNGEKIPGIGILDMYTVYDSTRHIGNIVEKCDIIDDVIVGFENHSGMVYFDSITPLGDVLNGFGNNRELKSEGAVYKNLIASYLHGPLLPKNPKLCDYIILRALEKKYDVASLADLNDSIENEAHNWAVEKFM